MDHVRLDASRTHIAHVVNRGGPSELWLDGVRLEGLPRGVYGPPELSGDGRISLTVAAVADTTDAWSVPGPVRLTRSASGGVDRASLREPEARAFESFDGRRIPYLLYGEAGQPTLCFVHGGPESQYRGSLNPVVAYLVSRGIAVAAPNVRGSTGYGRDYHHLDDVERRLDSVRDLAALAQALGAGAGVPVAVMGGSYGGYMTMAAITEHPELWAAAVNIVGIVNFVTFLERTGAYRRALREAEYGSLERRPRIPRAHLPDPQGRSHRLPAARGARRERPTRTGRRGRAGRSRPSRTRPRGRISPLRGRRTWHREAPKPPRLLPADRDLPRTASRPWLTGPDLAGARARLAGLAWRTPALNVAALDRECGCEIWLKPECLQRTGSFKYRGATNAVRQLPEGTPGVVCISSGNHAQAVARAAHEAGIGCLAVMPIDSNPTKIAATAGYGADVERDGVTAENREQIGRARAAERGWPLIHPFDDWNVISGQATAALELLEDAPPLDTIVTPIGGGGLLSGTALACAESRRARYGVPSPRRATTRTARSPRVSACGSTVRRRRSPTACGRCRWASAPSRCCATAARASRSSATTSCERRWRSSGRGRSS